jgi:hypothetical protein
MRFVSVSATVAVAILFALIVWPVACGAGTIEVSVPDTCAAPGDTLWLPIFTTDVTDSGVYGYNMIVHFDTAFVEVDSLTSDGTIAAVWGGSALVWHLAEGDDSLRIAAAGIQPLSGAGILVRIGFRVLESAPTDSSTVISIPDAVLRDDPEKPPTITHPGLLTIPCTAGSGVKGEEQERLEIDWLDPARIRWYLESGSDAAGDLRIYDPMGRLVVEVEPTTSATAAVYVWTGRTDSGRRAAAGVYFYRLEAGRRLWGGKIGILR